MMLANVGKNVQTKKFLVQKLNEPAVETYFLLERTYGAENGPPFLDVQPSGAEKNRFFLTRNSPAQKKVTVF